MDIEQTIDKPQQFGVFLLWEICLTNVYGYLTVIIFPLLASFSFHQQCFVKILYEDSWDEALVASWRG